MPELSSSFPKFRNFNKLVRFPVILRALHLQKSEANLIRAPLMTLRLFSFGADDLAYHFFTFRKIVFIFPFLYTSFAKIFNYF